MIECGTCAFADHQQFYPKRLQPHERLGFYAKQFSLVEIDSTYYALPKQEYVKRWTEQTPSNFTFNVKVHNTMTLHDRSLADFYDKKAVFHDFMAVIEPLIAANKLGAIHFSFPPWFRKTSEHLAYIVAARQFFGNFPVAIEFRHQSWFQDDEAMDTLNFLRDLCAIHVVVDEPQVTASCVPFIPAVTDTRLSIVRLHGRNQETWMQPGLATSGERFNYLYSRSEIYEIAEVAEALHEEAQSVHILMNNNYRNYAIQNAMMMKKRIIPTKLNDSMTNWFAQQETFDF